MECSLDHFRSTTPHPLLTPSSSKAQLGGVTRTTAPVPPPAPGLEEEKNVLEAIYGPEFEALGPSEWRTGRRGGGQVPHLKSDPGWQRVRGARVFVRRVLSYRTCIDHQRGQSTSQTAISSNFFNETF